MPDNSQPTQATQPVYGPPVAPQPETVPSDADTATIQPVTDGSQIPGGVQTSQPQLHGIPGAVEGAISPKTVNTEWQQRQQIAQSNVRFESARAEQAAALAFHDHLINNELSDEMKAKAFDRGMSQTAELQSWTGQAPMITEDSTDAVAGVKDQLAKMNGGAVPVISVVHMPGGDGQNGYLAVFNLSQVAQSKVAPEYIKEYADKTGQDADLLKQRWATANVDQRTAMSQDALQFLHPQLDSKNPVGQALMYESMKRGWLLKHPDAADGGKWFDDQASFVRGQLKDVQAAIQQQNQLKNQQAQQLANSKETGKRQADIANPQLQKPGAANANAQLFEGTDASGNQVAGTPDELNAAGVKNFVKMPALIQTQTLAAREMTSPDGLFATAKSQIQNLASKGELGAVASRWNNFWAGQGLNGDQQAFRGTLALIATKLMQAHMGNRGGKDAMQHFAELVPENSTPQALATALNNEFGYVNALAKRPKAVNNGQ